MRQLILELLPETKPGLDNFVTGDNMAALNGMKNWLAPKNTEPLFFLWGEEGCGKTHLLKASTLPYHDAALNPPLKMLDRQPLQCAVNHVQALDETGQIVLFNLFNHFRHEKGKLLIAADCPPKKLNLREDLRTRLGSGLIYRLAPLSDPEKKNVLLKEAEKRKLPLSEEMVDYLLMRAPRDMSNLMALLSAIDRYSLEHKRVITQTLLREILHNFPFPPTH